MLAVRPFRISAWRFCASAAVCAALGVVTHSMALAAGGGVGKPVDAHPEGSPAPLRIPMEPMGFQALSGKYLLTGATGMTVDFVDSDHLLVTFNSRSLMKREPDEQPGDEDRIVDAVLLQLPDGKVLARTEWRLHDQVQYLWNLGHGRFLLRVRDRLTMLAPLERLAAGDAFRGTPVLDLSQNGDDRRLVALSVSSDDDLLTVETMRSAPGSAGAESHVTFSGNDDGAGVQINFYRLHDSPEGFRAELAGVVRARAAITVPMTSAGILDILSGGKDRWLFNVDEHAGKVDELAEWDTTCFPRVTFVSHSEFVAFGCHSGEDPRQIAGFNIKGEQMWEQGLYESFDSPAFAFAPAAGRFALERTLLNAPIDDSFGLMESMASGEEVRVYQTETGKVLLKVNVSPAERAGGNFALSPDGMRLAAFDQVSQRKTSKLGDEYTQSATSLVVYPLPPLSQQDRTQLKELEAKAPVDTGARIDASLVRVAAASAARAGEHAGIDLPDSPSTAAPPTATTKSAAPRAAVAHLPKAPTTATDSTDTSAPSAGDEEPGNPAMTGELTLSPLAGPGSAGADADDSEKVRQPPTLYQPGETPQAAAQKKGQ
jgi:hypothetical protein